MEKVIITGGTGAIGVALISTLIEKGVEVIVLSRKNSRRREAIPKDKLVSVVDCSLQEMADFTPNFNADAFFHLAWEGTTGNDRMDMQKQLNNIQYTLDAVMLAKRARCKRFIGAGSQAEYGRVNQKLTADTPTHPENGYGIAKLCAGQMSRILANQLGIEHIWTRILSVYGPCDGEASLVMTMINKLQLGETPQTTKGEQIWDYINSSDAAEAMYRLWKRGVDGKTYCIGSGEERPLREYIEAIRDCVNPACNIDFGAIPYPDKQVMYLSANINELKKDTGFEPKIEFSEGIKRIVEGRK